MRSPLTLLKDSLNIFKSNPQLFIGIYLVPGALSFVLGLFGDSFERPGDFTPAMGVIMLLLALVTIVLSIFMGIAMTYAAGDRTISIMEAYTKAKGLFWQYLVLSILVGLTVLAGFVLLIVPGIIFMVWFAFAYYVLIFEGMSGTAAMKRSKELVSGRWFPVFGRMAILILFSIVCGFIIGVISGIFAGGTGDVVGLVLTFILNIFLVSISVIYMYELYLDLKGGAAQAVPSTAPQGQPETLQADPAASVGGAQTM